MYNRTEKTHTLLRGQKTALGTNVQHTFKKTEKKGSGVSKMMDKIALFILLIGGINWGLVGLFGFDLVAWAFGGSGSVISRIIYIVVALSALWCISLFFKRNELVEAE